MENKGNTVHSRESITESNRASTAPRLADPSTTQPSAPPSEHESPPAPPRDKSGSVSLANWWNRTRYGLYAPIYERVAAPLEPGRERSIERLDLGPDDRILILGSGPGLDLRYLPGDASITAIDLTPTMVRRTERRANDLGIDIDARVGDAQDLPFEAAAFDAVLLHLILTVVPDPKAVAAEAARVLDLDGRVSIYDKFIHPTESPSLLRRTFNPMAKALFSDLTRRLEPLIEPTDLVLGEKEPYLGGLYTVTIGQPAH